MLTYGFYNSKFKVQNSKFKFALSELSIQNLDFVTFHSGLLYIYRYGDVIGCNARQWGSCGVLGKKNSTFSKKKRRFVF